MNLPLSNGIIQIEKLCAAHADAIAEAINVSADSISQWLDAYFAPRTPDAVASFITDWAQAWESGVKYGLIGREVQSKRLIGFGLLNQINHKHRFANLGYWIRSDATGRGYATAFTRLLSKFGFETLGLVRIELVIEPGNAASLRVAEKAGGLREGYLRNRLTVNGEARDALMFSLTPGTVPHSHEMMARSNPKEVVRKWVDAFNEADAAKLASYYAEDAINHQVAESPLRGRKAIQEMFQKEFAHAKMTCIVENLFEDGEWAMLEWRDPNGLRGCGFFHIVDGWISFQRGYWDKLSFLRLQGLPLPTR